MLSLTKMLTGEINYGDQMRYGKDAAREKNGTAPGKGPVVVWNYTNRCNLSCRHCYAAVGNRPGCELTTREAMKVIDDLADFHVPVILFSGGEPLCREDFFELAEYAGEKGIRVTLSTNGTLITEEMAEKLHACRIGYVGISLDGRREVNDDFRGLSGAYDMALAGIRSCRKAGQRVGLRFTLNRMNFRDVPEILDLVEREDIDRVCFYHLVYSGRGGEILDQDLSGQQTREALDIIIDKVLEFQKKGLKKEILTVDNHTDGVYLYLKYREKDPERASHILRLLRNNGGNRCGMAIGSIDAFGNVHPDQFTQQHTLGNVLDRPFGEIWSDVSNPLMAGLKDRKPLLPKACRECSWLDVCNGNFRTRAEAVSGDYWGFDPACFLTEEERDDRA